MSAQDIPVVVTGATGRIGGTLAIQLAARGLKVRALSRHPEQARFLVSSGVEPVRADIDDAGGIAAVLAGCDRLFLLSPDHKQQAERECRVIDLAAAAGIRHIVKVSAYAAGLEPPISYGLLHRQVERHLANSGMAWTVLRPYMFMQNFFEFSRSIAAKQMFMAPFADTPIAFIDSRDVARVAAEILSTGGHEERCYELTGPAALTCAEAAQVLTNALGREIRYRSVPAWLAGIGMRLDGTSGWDVRMRIALFKMIAAGGEAQANNTIEDLSHAPATSFRTFVDDHLSRFSVS